jgi:hypothetical protein
MIDPHERDAGTPASTAADCNPWQTAGPILGDRAMRMLSGAFLLAMIYVAPDAPLRWFGLVGIVPLLAGLAGTFPFRKPMLRSACCVKALSEARARW